jgi:hypothetical protein
MLQVWSHLINPSMTIDSILDQQSNRKISKILEAYQITLTMPHFRFPYLLICYGIHWWEQVFSNLKWIIMKFNRQDHQFSLILLIKKIHARMPKILFLFFLLWLFFKGSLNVQIYIFFAMKLYEELWTFDIS